MERRGIVLGGRTIKLHIKCNLSKFEIKKICRHDWIN